MVASCEKDCRFLKGVSAGTGDVDGKTATFQVAGDEALQALKGALAEAGYPAAN